MAFTAYTGLPGSGKSYNVVKHILLPAVKQGRPVWTNIPLNEEVWLEEFGYCPVQFKTEDAAKNPNFFLEELPKGVLCVVDEVQLIWPSGMSVHQFSKEQREFFSMHRHMVGEEGFATQIILVTQDMGHIANYLRSLTEFTFHHKKLTELGLNKYVVAQYQGSVTGSSPSEKSLISRSAPRSYEKEIYKFYKTSTQSETGLVGDEVRADKRSSIWNGSKIWWLLAGGVLVPILGIYATVSFFQNFGGKDEIDQTTAQTISAQSTTAQTQQVAPIVKTPPVPEPFQDFDIFISSNIGVYPRIDYRFFLKDKDSAVSLDLHQLRRIGYSIEPIDECMVALEWNTKKRYVMCELPSDQQDEQIIDGFI
jgi:zona occludens toxin